MGRKPPFDRESAADYRVDRLGNDPRRTARTLSAYCLSFAQGRPRTSLNAVTHNPPPTQSRSDCNGLWMKGMTTPVTRVDRSLQMELRKAPEALGYASGDRWYASAQRSEQNHGPVGVVLRYAS